jgi:hypothetical protein
MYTHGICRDIANNRNIVADFFFLLLHCCEILSFLLETIVSLLLPYSDDLISFDLLCLTPLSTISWRPVLVVEEAGVPGENHDYGQMVSFITF